MAICSLVYCNICGDTGVSRGNIAHHECGECFPFSIGDQVTFTHNSRAVKGTVADLGDVIPGRKRLVLIRPKRVVMERGNAGKNFQVPADKISKLDAAA